MNSFEHYLEFVFNHQRWLWAIAGGCIGSFISVLVYRLPIIWAARRAGQEPPFSLSLPRSACPVCKNTLRAWANLPVVGYLASRGHCSHCPIPLRYLLLELAGAGWALLATYVWTQPYAVLAWSIAGWGLLALGWLWSERAPAQS